jgi:hypothetical protein
MPPRFDLSQSVFAHLALYKECDGIHRNFSQKWASPHRGFGGGFNRDLRFAVCALLARGCAVSQRGPDACLARSLFDRASRLRQRSGRGHHLEHCVRLDIRDHIWNDLQQPRAVSRTCPAESSLNPLDRLRHASATRAYSSVIFVQESGRLPCALFTR